MADDRQERYAAAAYESVNPGFRWVDAIPEDRDAFRRDVAGVMAVADAELDSAKRHLDARRIELLRVNERHAGENARLRAELETWQARYRSSVETYRDMAAIISRVRAVVNTLGQRSDGAYSGLVDLFRAALGGVRCVGCGETNGPNCADGSCCRG